MLFKKQQKGIFYLLAGRNSVLESVSSFYKNYDYSGEYKLIVFYFNQNLNHDIIDKLKSINTQVHLESIKTSIPSNLNEEDLYYNRKYLKYVDTSFKKNRIEFLHMCNFLFNIFNRDIFQNINFALRWDDDGLFKNKIKMDYFNVLNKGNKKAITGKLTSGSKIHNFETRINLFKTLTNYLKHFDIKPKCELISDIYKKFYNSETSFISEYLFHKTQFMSDFNVYDLSIFKNDHWKNWNNYINQSGGIYKYRWGENELITLFILIHYGDVITNLELWPNTYDPKGADSQSIFRSER